jgi:hypothetical protein
LLSELKDNLYWQICVRLGVTSDTVTEIEFQSQVPESRS